jgi:predicted RecA/RadA family phage recombinase
MKNYIRPGDTVTITAGGTIASGAGVLVGLLFGVAVRDATAGQPLEIATTGVFSLPKTSAQAWTVGAAIYWNGTNGEATTATTEGNVLIGVAVAVADNPSARGIVRLNGAAPAAAVPAPL